MAEAYLRLGKWEDALTTLQGVDRSGLEREERGKFEALIGRILDFKGGRKCALASELWRTRTGDR